MRGRVSVRNRELVEPPCARGILADATVAALKILILSPYPILPPLHGGRVRTAQLAQGLARAGADVAVLCPWYPGQPRNGTVAGTFTCYSHVLASNVLPRMLPWLAAPQVLLSFQPPPRRHLLAFNDYDVVQLDFCAQARWLSALPARAQVVYSAHNVERDFCEYDAARYLLSRASVQRIERLERLAVQRANLVLTCTAADASRLQQLYGEIRHTLVIPNGCSAALLDWDRSDLRAKSREALGLAPEDRAILFVGGDASHNRDAVEFLLLEVLPRLDQHARLIVAGRCGTVGRRNADGRAHFLGFVDDLRPYMAAADVGVNPVERGSGSSAKLLEYLAAGLPVLSTALGARGFTQPPAGVRVVPRAGFATALGGPLDDLIPDRTALRRLTWEQLGRDVLHEYERLGAS
jgi:glycosyltransferase involved in cell wall biosynthesis